MIRDVAPAKPTKCLTIHFIGKGIEFPKLRPPVVQQDIDASGYQVRATTSRMSSTLVMSQGEHATFGMAASGPSSSPQLTCPRFAGSTTCVFFDEFLRHLAQALTFEATRPMPLIL